MVRIELAIALRYQVTLPGADFIFNIQAAQTRRQWVVHEQLGVSQPVPLLMHTDPLTAARTLRLTAGLGPLNVEYRATLDLDHLIESVDRIPEVPVARLPPEVLTYLYPSRYCQSDQLNALAMAEFGGLRQGYARVAAIQRWVQQRVVFTPRSSNSTTSAVETLADGAGVCRDFAHLMIALCRPTSMLTSRSIWVTAGTFSTPPAPRFRWALCALAPAMTQPMPHLRPSSVPCSPSHRTSRCRPNSPRTRARCCPIGVRTGCRPTVGR